MYFVYCYSQAALHRSAQYGQNDISELLINHRADVNIQDKDGNSVLHYSSRRGSLAMVELLLRQGADVNIRNKQG